MGGRTSLTVRTALLLAISWSVLVEDSLEAKPLQASGKRRTVAELNEIIQSHQLNRTSKCRAIFDLFENYVQPKSANDFSEIFLDHSWIDQANIYVVVAVGGKIPVPWDPKNETLYFIGLFPNKNKWSDRVIYLTLTAPQLARQDLISLLKGHEPSAPGIKVSAFALCGPTPADADQLPCKLFPSELRR